MGNVRECTEHFFCAFVYEGTDLINQKPRIMKKIMRRLRAVEMKCNAILSELRVLRAVKVGALRDMERSARVLHQLSVRERKELEERKKVEGRKDGL